MDFRLKSIIYFCADMAKMAAFYTDVIGLQPLPNDKYPADEWQEFQGDGLRLCLHRSSKAGSPQGNKNKLVFQVDDVGAARAHLIAHNVKMGVHHIWGEMEASDG